LSACGSRACAEPARESSAVQARQAAGRPPCSARLNFLPFCLYAFLPLCLWLRVLRHVCLLVARAPRKQKQKQAPKLARLRQLGATLGQQVSPLRPTVSPPRPASSHTATRASGFASSHFSGCTQSELCPFSIRRLNLFPNLIGSQSSANPALWPLWQPARPPTQSSTHKSREHQPCSSLRSGRGAPTVGVG